MPQQLSPNDFLRQLAERVTKLRNDEGLSQAGMAMRIGGVSKDAYAKWEQRGRLPAWAIYRICVEFNVPSWWLLTGTFNEPDPSRDSSPLPFRQHTAQ